MPYRLPRRIKEKETKAAIYGRLQNIIKLNYSLLKLYDNAMGTDDCQIIDAIRLLEAVSENYKPE